VILVISSPPLTVSITTIAGTEKEGLAVTGNGNHATAIAGHGGAPDRQRAASIATYETRAPQVSAASCDGPQLVCMPHWTASPVAGWSPGNPGLKKHRFEC
jgi:hypothetical protein